MLDAPVSRVWCGVWCVAQHAAFHADKQVRRTTVILKVVSRPDEVKPGKTVTWTDEIRDLPPVQPSRLGGGCKLIELKYLLTVYDIHC